MPDLDIIAINVPRGWRRPCRLLEAGADHREIARPLLGALSAAVRAANGFPHLERSRNLIEAVRAGNLTLFEALSTVRSRDLLAPGYLGFLAQKATGELIVAASSGRMQGDVTRALVERYFEKVLDACFFSRLPIVFPRLASPAELDRLRDRCRQEVGEPLARMAEMLCNDPGANRFRAAPVRSRIRHATKELLERPLL
ncbi:MAG: hypothetical protein SCH98_15345 [Deferrisomatales bacterium]|nr:hypothetical protein [Deferrisomatales bacterium]